jgi:hypothetical protein
VISDIIVVWRAWVIWFDNRRMQWFFAFCLATIIGKFHLCLNIFPIADVSFSVTSFAFASMSVLSFIKGHERWSNLTLNFLGTFPLLFTNFVATSSIMYKAWCDTCSSSSMGWLAHISLPLGIFVATSVPSTPTAGQQVLRGFSSF